MEQENSNKEIKLSVVQRTNIICQNLGDGDDGYQITTNYILLSDKPVLSFNQKNWVSALYLCQCDLEPKEYFLLNQISGAEATVSFDIEIGEYIQYNPIESLDYLVDDCDSINPRFFVNQFRTERICNILQHFNKDYLYIPYLPKENLLAINRYDHRPTPIDKNRFECLYEIDLIKNSNISELQKPEPISSNTLDIYLCIPSKYLMESGETQYFLASNIPDVIEFIPEGIRSELYNLICSYKYYKINQGDYIKGQKITKAIKMLNNSVERWSYGPTIRFHIGSEYVCKHKIPVDFLIQKYRAAYIFQQLKNQLL